MKTLKYLVIFSVILVNSVSYAQDAQEIIKKVQSKYENITDAKATFTQTLKSSGGKANSSSGVIYIKKADKYRIEAGGQVIITDGKTSWSYSPRRKQVVIDNYKDDGNSFSPNKFLFSYPENFYSDLDGEENVGGVDCYIIKLTPRSGGSVKSAKLWVDKNEDLIRKINIVTNESSNTYSLKNISLDTGLSPSKFSFTPPEGVEVIDLR
ncbi:MAG: outer membrane lipoprotein chaperone LolA [Ignavibacteria bacterium]|jgi:outer membrane lipoprotein carrier protein|nr:outer membrane lipoprotein chaperone LolA [Ignavibacteria bacterium]